MCCRCCQLVLQCEDHSPGEEDVAASVQREMEKMETAIRGAVERFTAMLENSRAKDTGTQLEVRLCVHKLTKTLFLFCFPGSGKSLLYNFSK